MKTAKTIEVRAVVTPNCAIDNRNQMSSHKMLQNPETKKKQKYQPIHFPSETGLVIGDKNWGELPALVKYHSDAVIHHTFQLDA